MKYTGQEAVKQLSVLFGTTLEEMAKEIADIKENCRTNFFLTIHSLSNDPIYDFEISILMVDDTGVIDCDFVEWQGKLRNYYAEPEILYNDTSIDTYESNQYIAFDTDLLAENLLIMIDNESKYVSDNNKVLMIEQRSNKLYLSFDDLKQAIEVFADNKDKENAIEKFVSSLWEKDRGKFDEKEQDSEFDERW